MTADLDLLRQMRVLVVEDSPLVAMMLVEELEALGAIVIGPAGAMEEAMNLLDRHQVDAAIMDVELGDTLAFPLADLLGRRDVPFVLTTGHDAEFLPARFAGIPYSAKPAPAAEVLSMLAGRIAAGR